MAADDPTKESHPDEATQRVLSDDCPPKSKRSPPCSPPSHAPEPVIPSLAPGENVVANTNALLEPDDPESDPDNVFDDADSAFGSEHSATTSISESMIEQVKEHGRQYKGYLGAKYVLPMDEQEMERLDLQCHLVWLTLDKRLSLAPISNPLRAMDVGCGTGMWAIDFADEHPGTDVLGVDIAPGQPNMAPPNLRFELDDLEREWTFTSKFDYIHSQLMIGAFQDWPKFFQQSFDNLESGGFLEVADIDFVIKCDDGTLPSDSALAVWHDEMHKGAALAGFPLDAISKVPDMMREAGFVDVIAIPFPWPINTWPRDPKHKEVGRWAMENFTMGCESMSQALFTRALGWSIDEVRVFMSQVRNDLKNRRMHAYWNFWVVYGRKP